jgi:DNA-binding MarR family transcriptional regulator
VKSLQAMAQMLNTMRTFLGVTDIPLQHILVFCEVVDHGEISMGEIMKLVGLTQSSVSRNVDKLGRGSPGEPGYGLVESYEDPAYRKRKLVRVTPRGKELAKAVSKAAARYLEPTA